MSYDENNIFAKILRGEIPCERVFENEIALAFHDVAPAAPTHVLVIPKLQASSFDDFVKRHPTQIEPFFQAVQQVADKLEVVSSGYRLITNHGADASQTVPHFHVHILAGKPLGGLLADDSLNR
jgi:diadenosine tetraphosphate (Ap4A) HIT family hydrolase